MALSWVPNWPWNAVGAMIYLVIILILVAFLIGAPTFLYAMAVAFVGNLVLPLVGLPQLIWWQLWVGMLFVLFPVGLWLLAKMD